MSSCPLGFKGELPAGHPPVAGLSNPLNLNSNESNWTVTILVLDFIFLSLVALSLIYSDRFIFTKSRKGIPTLQPYPLIGSTPFMIKIISGKIKAIEAMFQTTQTIGKGNRPWTFTGPGLGGRVTFLNHPAYINWVQKTNFENYEKGPDFRRAFGDVLGLHGIFVADGSPWKAQRKMASHIFSVGNFRTHVQNTIQGDLTTLTTLIDRLIPTGQKVNLQDVFFRFTLSSFATMAFSAEMGCLPSDPEQLSKQVEFAAAFDYAQLVIDARVVNPIAKILEIFSQQGRNMRKSIKTLNEYCYKIIDSRLESKAQGSARGAVDSKGGQDLLELFMNQGFQRDDLLPVVLNFLIAGRDTTAQTLAWLFYEFYLNPEVVKKCREEIDTVLGGRQMAYDDLKSMTYLHATFYEATRLHPAVPKNIKRAVKDDVIKPYQQPGFDMEKSTMNNASGSGLQERLPDLRIMKGESVSWSDWVMSRTPEVWGDDCTEFKPERFIEEKADGEKSIKNLGSALFHSFNHGPRLCLGQTLATYEGCAVVAAILSSYDVVYDAEALKNDPPMYGDSVTHPIENPYLVSFRKRT